MKRRIWRRVMHKPPALAWFWFRLWWNTFSFYHSVLNICWKRCSFCFLSFYNFCSVRLATSKKETNKTLIYLSNEFFVHFHSFRPQKSPNFQRTRTDIRCFRRFLSVSVPFFRVCSSEMNCSDTVESVTWARFWQRHREIVRHHLISDRKQNLAPRARVGGVGDAILTSCLDASKLSRKSVWCSTGVIAQI